MKNRRREIEPLEKRVVAALKDSYELGYSDGIEDENVRTNTLTKKLKEAYNNGLNDAWECAKKIYDFSCEELSEVFPESGDSPFCSYSASEAVKKIKEYEDWQKHDCKDCEHGLFNLDTSALCYDCIKGIKDNFEPKQTDATDINDGSIKVGDEVSCPQIDSKGIVIQTANKDTLLVLTNSMDGLLRTDDSKVARTGRTFPQIAEVLKLL